MFSRGPLHGDENERVVMRPDERVERAIDVVLDFTNGSLEGESDVVEPVLSRAIGRLPGFASVRRRMGSFVFQISQSISREMFTHGTRI